MLERKTDSPVVELKREAENEYCEQSDVTLIDESVIVPEEKEKTDSVKVECKRREKEERVSDPVVMTNGEYVREEDVPPIV